MRRFLTFATAMLALTTPQHIGARATADNAPQSAPRPHESAPDIPATLAGRWRSAPFELPLVSDLHKSVYGPNATSVRVTDIVIRPTGHGTFTVTNMVRNGRGAVVAGTRSVEELTFTLGPSETAPGGRTRHGTKVARAERRYPDPPTSTFSLEGASLQLYPPADAKGQLEVRYDTPEGTGSFWETLRPAGAGRPATASRTPGR
jgi:hypothetical protein